MRIISTWLTGNATPRSFTGILEDVSCTYPAANPPSRELFDLGDYRSIGRENFYCWTPKKNIPATPILPEYVRAYQSLVVTYPKGTLVTGTTTYRFTDNPQQNRDIPTPCGWIQGGLSNCLPREKALSFEEQEHEKEKLVRGQISPDGFLSGGWDTNAIYRDKDGQTLVYRDAPLWQAYSRAERNFHDAVDIPDDHPNKLAIIKLLKTEMVDDLGIIIDTGTVERELEGADATWTQYTNVSHCKDPAEAFHREFSDRDDFEQYPTSIFKVTGIAAWKNGFNAMKMNTHKISCDISRCMLAHGDISAQLRGSLRLRHRRRMAKECRQRAAVYRAQYAAWNDERPLSISHKELFV